MSNVAKMGDRALGLLSKILFNLKLYFYRMCSFFMCRVQFLVGYGDFFKSVTRSTLNLILSHCNLIY